MTASLAILRRRAKIIKAIRQFFNGQEYLEVETPVRLPSLVPEINIVPQTSESWFLQPSPELCMKRLLGRGAERIFQLCRCFRKGERGRLHLPEMTMLEWYRVGIDYAALMDECERLIKHIAKELAVERLGWGAHQISVTADWQRLTLNEAFGKYAPCSLAEAMASGCYEEVLVEYVEPFLGIERPVFVHDYPASMASLARLRGDNPQVAERFELYMGGVELANGFSELVDPAEQKSRFEKERAEIIVSGRAPGPMPEKFLADLEIIPEAAGIALGVDRLVMLFTGSLVINEVVAFTPESL